MVHQVSEAFKNAFETIFKSDNGSGKSDEKTKDTIADRNGDKLILDQRISDWFRCNSCDYESEEKDGFPPPRSPTGFVFVLLPWQWYWPWRHP